ncbi:MAG TPA: hypothetical protein VFN74_00370 [Chloroflexota bacterium]|nr:hypothetical protein [Chloroflexota bacterium]
MITAELARELKVAQLPWRPRRGDMVVDRLNIPYLVLRDGTDDAGGVEIDTGEGVDRRPFLGLTWLPRVDQMLDYLGKRGSVSIERAGGGWRVKVDDKEFAATDSGEAVGKALHHVLVRAL